MNLARLNVSLTKHGAHKIALLLKDLPANEILQHLDGSHKHINIDGVQARKNLSIDAKDSVPALWDDARNLGQECINALVFLAIVFSHHKLIEAMARGKTAPLRGSVVRGDAIDGKAYTNFKHTLEELGFSLLATADRTDYDLSPLLKVVGLAPLALELLKLKLRAANWTGATDAVDEMVNLDFHSSLSMSESLFRSWLAVSAIGDERSLDFFAGKDEAPTQPFLFKAGHTPRKTGRVARRQSQSEQEAELLHNEIQTALYRKLVKKFGEASVGTEQATGLGTSVDLVVQHEDYRVFYEIKIASTVRACVRQALPQLLEYAYWRCSDDLARRLVIVGTFEMTPDVRAYLHFLRERFDIPIWYKRFVLKRTRGNGGA